MNKHPLDEGPEVRIPSSSSSFYLPALHSLATLACAFSVSSPPCPMNQNFFPKSLFPPWQWAVPPWQCPGGAQVLLTQQSRTAVPQALLSKPRSPAACPCHQDSAAAEQELSEPFHHRAIGPVVPAIPLETLKPFYQNPGLILKWTLWDPHHPEQRHCLGIKQDNNYISTQALALQNNTSKNTTSIGSVTCIHEVAWKMR